MIKSSGTDEITAELAAAAQVHANNALLREVRRLEERVSALEHQPVRTETPIVRDRNGTALFVGDEIIATPDDANNCLTVTIEAVAANGMLLVKPNFIDPRTIVLRKRGDGDVPLDSD